MRSHELASLAGVSVRTLRHYHRVGVLTEPDRSSNGYRSYTVHDLVLLLRIRHLAALGVPLDAMTALLDAEDEDHTAVVSRLEAEVDRKIAHLQRQKELLGLIKTHRVPPDLPPGPGRVIAALAAPDLSPAANRLDREQALLLTHLVAGRGQHGLMKLYAQLTEPCVRAVLLEVARDLDGLPQDASEVAIDAVVHRVTTQLAPVVADLGLALQDLVPEGARARELLQAHQHDALNRAQRSALARISERLP